MIPARIQKKLMNLYIFTDLLKMRTKIPKTKAAAAREIRDRDRRVRALVRKAYKIPFYRERFDAAGVKPSDIQRGEDLLKLPLLTKDDLRTWMGAEAKKKRYRDWIVDTTSGSTGKPLSILFTPREKAFMKANWIRVMMRCGYNPFTGKTMSRINAHDENPGGPDGAVQKLGILRRAFVDQYAPEKEVIEAINAYRPDWLYMNKTELMRLVLFANRTGTKIFHPKFYDPVSEKVDENNRKLFRKVLGDGIVDSYGSAETGACMLRVPGAEDYVIHSDYFMVDLVDENGKRSREGSVVITPLYKTDLPIINYAIGDKATAVKRDGIRYVTDIHGRMNDYFYYENGEVTSFFEVTPVIAHCPDILQIRFIEESFDLIRVQIVRDENAGMTREQLEAYIESSLNKIFKKPFRFVFDWMDSIPPDENGKLRMIVARVTPQSSL